MESLDLGRHDQCIVSESLSYKSIVSTLELWFKHIRWCYWASQLDRAIHGVLVYMIMSSWWLVYKYFINDSEEPQFISPKDHALEDGFENSSPRGLLLPTKISSNIIPWANFPTSRTTGFVGLFHGSRWMDTAECSLDGQKPPAEANVAQKKILLVVSFCKKNHKKTIGFGAFEDMLYLSKSMDFVSYMEQCTDSDGPVDLSWAQWS